MISIILSHISFDQFGFGLIDDGMICEINCWENWYKLFFTSSIIVIYYFYPPWPISSHFSNWVIKSAAPNNLFSVPARQIKTPARYKSFPGIKALLIAIRGMGGGSGDKLFVSSFTFSAMKRKLINKIELEKFSLVQFNFVYQFSVTLESKAFHPRILWMKEGLSCPSITYNFFFNKWHKLAFETISKKFVFVFRTSDELFTGRKYKTAKWFYQWNILFRWKMSFSTRIINNKIFTIRFIFKVWTLWVLVKNCWCCIVYMIFWDCKVYWRNSFYGLLSNSARVQLG